MKSFYLSLFSFALSNPFSAEVYGDSGSQNQVVVQNLANIELPVKGTIVRGASSSVDLVIAEKCHGKTEGVGIVVDPGYIENGGKVDIKSEIPWKSNTAGHFSHNITKDVFPIKTQMEFTPNEISDLVELTVFVKCTDSDDYKIKHEFPILENPKLGSNVPFYIDLANTLNSMKNWVADLHDKNYHWETIKNVPNKIWNWLFTRKD